MMQYFTHNRILTKYILSIFVVFALLAPISISLTQPNTSENSSALAPVSTQLSITYAQQPANPSAASTWEQTLGNVVLSTAAFFTYIGGKILETSVDKLVFGMGDLINNRGLGISIDTTWKVIRDICNLAFIFGFVYVGIRTILDPENANTKRFLSRIILGALLINFSLFFTKIVIDFSNFTAVQLYQSMVSGSGNISETFMKLLGLSGFYQVPDPKGLANVSGWGGFWFYLMGAVMFLVSAFVMAAGGVMLIVRFVALILIMIFSPILFAATVFPKTEEYASKLWGYLINYSFFAPVYLLLLLVSISILQGVSTSLGLSNKTLSEAFRNQNDAFGIILNFVIVILFLIFSLLVASKMGVAGGNMAVSVGNNLRGRVQGAMGRNIIGRPAAALLDKYEKDSANVKNMKGARGIVNRSIQKTLDFTGADRSIRNTLESGKKAKFGSEYSLKDDKEYWKERKSDRARINNLSKIDDAAGDFVNAPANSDADKNQIEFYKTIRDASQAQLLETVKELESGDPKYKAVARAMTNAQFDKFMEEKSENFDDNKKTELRKAREEYFDSIKGNPDATRREIHQDYRKAKDAAKISTKILTSNEATTHITPEIFHNMIEQKVDIMTQRKVYENLIALGDTLDDTMRQYLDSPYIQQRFGVSKSSETRVPHKSFKQKLKEAGKI